MAALENGIIGLLFSIMWKSLLAAVLQALEAASNEYLLLFKPEPIMPGISVSMHVAC